MVPTLKYDDRVLVTRILYYLHGPERGDIVVFADPNPEHVPDRSGLGEACTGSPRGSVRRSRRTRTSSSG